jgi:hypothetical protein
MGTNMKFEDAVNVLVRKAVGKRATKKELKEALAAVDKWACGECKDDKKKKKPEKVEL